MGMDAYKAKSRDNVWSNSRDDRNTQAALRQLQTIGESNNVAAKS